MVRAKWGRMILLSGLAACTLLWQMAGGTPAYAQQGAAATGSVTGRITDTSGGVFQGATITLQQKGGGAPLVTESNEDGYYRFPFVGPGNYSLKAQKTGFSDVVIPELEVQVQRTATLDITMQPGKVVEEISVSASATSLQTQTSTLSGVVDSRTETELPLPMRDPSQLINLVAGVTNDNRGYLTGTTGNAGGLSYQGRLSFSMNGGGRSTAVSMVDGVNVTIDAGDFSSVPIVPTPDFTQEFTAQTNVQPAQFGRGEGVLNIVTRSGTNAIHGAAFEFLQNNVLNSTNLFTNRAHGTNPHLERNQYGAALGGPVILPHVYDGRNKTFWFFNLERMNQLAATSISQRVPTAAELNGDFSNDYTTSGVLVPIYNPYSTTINESTGAVTRTQFQGNIIPTNLIQPYSQAWAKYYPLPNNAGILGTGGVNTGSGNFAVTGSAPVNWNRMDAKVDEDVNASNRVMFRFSNSLYYAHPVDFYHNIANSYGLSSRNNPQHGMNVVTSWTWTASPTFVVSQAINISRFTDESIVPLFDNTTLGGPFANGAIAGYENAYSGGATFPTITPSGYAGLGAGQPYNEPFANYSYQINAVKTRGKHTLNAGFEFEYLEGAADFIRGFPAALNYSGFTNGPNPLNPAANTGNGFADMLLGLPANSSNLTAGTSNYLISKYGAWYLQDDIRVTHKLTVNLGARYDFMTPAIARHDIKFMFNPLTPNALGSAIGPNTGGQSLNQYITSLGGGPLQGAIVFPNSGLSQGRGIVPTDLHDIAPRLGFAYSPTQKTVVRGGIARLYSLSPVAPGAFSNAGGPFSAATNIVAQTDGYTPVVSPTNYFPNGFNVSTGNTLGPLTLLGNSVGAGSTTTQVTPYYNQWNIGVERQLPGNMTLGVAYAGGEAHRLICAHGVCNTDQIPPNILAQYGSKVTNVVPNPFYGIITNPTLALSRPTVALGQLLKQWPAYANVSYSNIGITQGLQSNHDTFHSSFNALEVQFNKHFSNGLNLVAAFTWSKTLADADAMDGGYLGPNVSYQQLVNFQAEYSMTADDVPKRLVLGHVYELPVGRGKTLGSNWGGVLDKTLGHWEFSGLSTFQSGYPMAISETGHTTGAQGGGDRPNLIGSPTAACNGGASRSAKIAGASLLATPFQTASPFYFGDSARTLPCLRDGIKNLDWSLMKGIPIKESFHMEFRAEFFNLTNRPQLGAPNTTFNSSGFGQVTTQFNSPRVIQFGLKLKW
jgi:hypothetical protein